MKLKSLNAAEWAAAVFALLLVLATLLPLVPSNQWWIRILDFPRVQIAALIVPALALLLFTGLSRRVDGRLLALALIICLGYQSFRIYPYTPIAMREVASARSCAARDLLRLMEANVLQDNRRAAPLLAMVGTQKPDILLLTETDDWWAAQLAGLRADFPYVVSVPLGNTYGMMLFSRLPLREPQVRYLFEPDIPSIHAGITLRSGKRIAFHGIHPRPPVPGQDTGDRDAEILVVGREVRQAARPAIVAGDLNDVAWSGTTTLFQEVSGLRDPCVGRNLYPTYPAALPLLRWPLDYVFVSPGFALRRLVRLPDIGCDHFPILVDRGTAEVGEAALPGRKLPGAVKEEVRETVEEAREEE